jgi:hypothetical protein
MFYEFYLYQGGKFFYFIHNEISQNIRKLNLQNCVCNNPNFSALKY